jgi:hypothetical protein
MCHQPPITSGPHCHDIPVNPGIVQQMLFDSEPALFGIYFTFELSHPELYIQIGRGFI